MQELKRFQIRGVGGEVVRATFGERIIDYWIPKGGSRHLLIAHDGQNVFDGRTSTHRRQTWKMAHSATRVSKKLGVTPPAIVAIWHSSSPAKPWGRASDLAPEDIFTSDQYIVPALRPTDENFSLGANKYLAQIFHEIVPAIAPGIAAENTAMIGSSMGGLATLYALSRHHDLFHTALSLSPHWTLSDETFVDKLIGALPQPGVHKVWMSRGTKGHDRNYGPLQDYADQLMEKRGYPPSRFQSKVYPRTGHNERSWARYLDEPMRFWLSE